ncbi:MAG: SDR family oxidoreductase [Acidobacteriota bacterium]
MSNSFQLRRVLITGAARGIGRKMAERFAARGAELVITDVQEELLEATRADLEAAGTRVRAYAVDVTDAEAIADLRDRVHGDLGRIDILVNNAGVVFGGPFLEVPLQQHALTYRVNVEGVMAMTHAFLPDLIEGNRGHAVFIASASGFVGLPNGATYASSKWAVIGFAESIRAEMKHQGHKHVAVTTVCPTYINTGMFEGVEPPKTTHLLDPDDIADKIVEAVEKRKIWLLEPWIVKVTPFLKHCLPTPLADFLSDAFGANQSMDQWKGHAPK